MKTIFLVEDDDSLQDIARMVFEQSGFNISIFGSGEDLLAESSRPDIYLLDKQLPGVDGLVVCKMLKAGEQTKGIPVIILSATPNIRASALDAGADDALEKPFSIHVLRNLILQHVGKTSTL